MSIPGFQDYTFDTDTVVRKSDLKVIKPRVTNKNSTVYKLKTDDGLWKSITLSRVKALCGYIIDMPACVIPVPDTGNKYYISTFGDIYSFYLYPQGVKLAPSIGTSGYLQVKIAYIGGTKRVSVHSLMAHVFIHPNYTKDGLVCMHKDNNKLNNNLSNLKVSTYSDNNKQAYYDGLNPGNGLKRNL